MKLGFSRWCPQGLRGTDRTTIKDPSAEAPRSAWDHGPVSVGTGLHCPFSECVLRGYWNYQLCFDPIARVPSSTTCPIGWRNSPGELICCAGSGAGGRLDVRGGFVTSPFSDGTVPTFDAPPMPVSPHGELTRLRSERAQWERRAAVAADAVAELDTALLTLNRAVKGNYFGDCVEGLGVYEGLRRAISSLSDEISSRSDRANRLASQCRLAASEIESADTEGAAGF